MALTDAVWLQNLTYSAEQTRRFVTALLTRGATIGSAVGGLVGSTDFLVTYAGSGLNVSAAAGEGYVAGSSTTSQGAYYARGSTATSLTPASANPTNPRIDLIYVQVNDTAYTGSTNNATCSIATGTPSSGANLTNKTGAPSLPVSSYALAYVLIPANASTISNVDILNVSTQATLGFAAGSGGQGIQIVSGAIGLNGTESVNVIVGAGTAQTLAAPATDIGNDITLTSANNLVLTMPTPARGAYCYAIVRQPASGTTTNTVTWTSVKWNLGTAPTMSTGASVYDFYQFVSDGTVWMGFVGGQNLH